MSLPTARVKNWGQFQHYKDRSPPWIKLHRALLDDFDYSSLPIASKALAPLLWLLAAESVEGSVCIDPSWLAFRLRWTEKDVSSGLTPLIDKGLLVADSAALARCYQSATPEAEAKRDTETKIEKARATASPRGSRLPPDWSPSDSDIAFAEEHGVPWKSTSQGFADWWHSKPGAGGLKLDWSATWRNWIRREAKSTPSGKPASGKTMGAIMDLQRTKDGLVKDGNSYGVPAVALLEFGAHPFAGDDSWHLDGLADGD